MLQKERLQNNYDFLRVLAAILVMFFHSFALLNKVYEEPLMVISKGKINTAFMGLSIFFSISGYLIAGSALRSPTLLNYLWKRLLRIQPLLLFLCILTILFLGPFFTTLSIGDYFSKFRTWSYLRNVMPVFGMQFTLPGVFSHNPAEAGVNGSLWTLIVEERLYLLMCLLFVLRLRRKYFIFFVLVVNVAFLIHTLYFINSYILFFDGAAFFYALIFLNSALLYVLKVNFTRRSYLYLIAGLVIFYIDMKFVLTDVLPVYSAPLIVSSIAHMKGILNKAGKWGDFTYGTYVFAFPVQQMLIDRLHIYEPYRLFLITFIIVAPLAVLSWHLIEKRFLRLKKMVQ